MSMGGIAIWCMHFLGNQAITLGDGQQGYSIISSAGSAALSFFLPIVGLVLAFAIIGADDKVSIYRICFGGTLVGCSICK